MELNWPNKSQALCFLSGKEKKLGNGVWIDNKSFFSHSNQFEKNTSRNGLKLRKVFGTPKDKTQNMLIYGDNLIGLKALYDKGIRVQHIYIDPPYNTGKDLYQYRDIFTHNQWLSMMYPRLKYLQKLLQDNGLIFIQINDKECAYLDLILREIFGLKNKIGSIIWRRRQSQANLKKTVSTIHDYILVYAKNKINIPNSILQNFNNLLWTNTGEFGHNQMASKEIKGYFGDKTIFDTPKPEILLYHILDNFSKEGDVILDSFAGSGTTLAVAHKMNRKWVGIENVYKSFELCKKRMQNIVQMQSNETDLKIDETIKWKGGGGFTTYGIENKEIDILPNGEGERENILEPYQRKTFQMKKGQTKINNTQKEILKLKLNHSKKDHTKSDQQSETVEIRKEINKKIQKIKSEVFEKSGQQEKNGKQNPYQSIFTFLRFKFTNLNNHNDLIKQIWKDVKKHKDVQNIPDFTQSLFSHPEFFVFCKKLLKTLHSAIRETGFLAIHCYEACYHPLKILLDEMFGEQNFIATFIWKKQMNQREIQDNEITSKKDILNIKGYWSDYIQYPYDYVILYAKNSGKMNFHKLPPSDKLYRNPDNDPRGPWISHPLVASKKSTNKKFTYKFKDGREVTRKWRYPPESILKLEEENRIHYTQPRKGVGVPRVKKFFSERLKEFRKTGKRGTTPNSLLIEEEHGILNWKYIYERNKSNCIDYKALGFKQLINFIDEITSSEEESHIII